MKKLLLSLSAVSILSGCVVVKDREPEKVTTTTTTSRHTTVAAPATTTVERTTVY